MTHDSERISANQEIGYLSQDDAEQAHIDRLGRQQVPLNTRSMPHPRGGNVRGFYDGEPDELTGPIHLDEQQHVTNRTGMAAVRAAFAEVDDRRIAEIAAGDEVYEAALRRARDSRRTQRNQSA